MKRWVVNLPDGKVWLAMQQNPKTVPPEFIGAQRVIFTLAVDELGAFVRANQMIKEQGQ
jgi:hypothetical protein